MYKGFIVEQEIKKIRIGCASGFWGDSQFSAQELVLHGQLNYLVFDYLAETTLGIMAKQRHHDKTQGYATDFLHIIKPLLPSIQQQKIKVICNAGGVNPFALVNLLQSQLSNTDLNIAVVRGDDLTYHAKLEHELISICKDESSTEDFLSVNAYLGATPIREALMRNADIIITGRIVDSALVLGPALYEFDWSLDDFNRLAMASIAGHIIECGAQCCGGNFTDWQTVSHFDTIGYPIIEIAENSEFIVTKTPYSGGLINKATVTEQLLYEIADPTCYQLPDVICDLSAIEINEIAPNQVAIKNVKGFAPSPYYKVSACYQSGYRARALFLIVGNDVTKKASVTCEAILQRINHVLEKISMRTFTKTQVEFLGTEAIYGHNANSLQTREIVVAFSVEHESKKACELFCNEIAQAALAMTPGITTLFGGRPKPTPIISLNSYLIEKNKISTAVVMQGETKICQNQMIFPEKNRVKKEINIPLPINQSNTKSVTVTLSRLALARSGDKGDSVNIGIIARHADYFPWLCERLTCERVKDYFSYYVEGAVARFVLPTLHSLNFVMEQALDGGGLASIRVDPLGKGFGQMILDLPIEVPADLIKD